MPGVQRRTAEVIIAEIGPDMTVFATARQGDRRRRALGPRRRLAHAQHRPALRRPRRRLLPTPRSRPHDQAPGRPARAPRPHRHPGGRLNSELVFPSVALAAVTACAAVVFLVREATTSDCDEFMSTRSAWDSAEVYDAPPSPRQQLADRIIACRTLLGREREEVRSAARSAGGRQPLGGVAPHDRTGTVARDGQRGDARGVHRRSRHQCGPVQLSRVPGARLCVPPGTPPP